MSHVEAAASLFGASDTSADFFSVTNNNSGDSTGADVNTSISAASSLKSDDLFNSNESSDLFRQGDMGSEASKLFASDTAPDFLAGGAEFTHSTPPSGNGSYGGDTQYYGGQEHPSYDSSSSSNVGTTGGDVQSWDGGQWDGLTAQAGYGNYQTMQSQGSSAYAPSYANYPQTGQETRSFTPSSSYIPTYSAEPVTSQIYSPSQSTYSPQKAYAPTNASQNTVATTNTASTYDPYKPQTVVQPPQTQQNPSISTSATTPYDPYAPPKTTTTTTSANTYSYPSSYSGNVGATTTPYQAHLNPPLPTIPQAYLPPPVVSTPSPSIPPPTPQVKNTTPFRPSKYNAYDPPVPAAKPSKRHPQHPSPQLRATSNRYDYHSTTPSTQPHVSGAGFPPQGSHFDSSQSSLGVAALGSSSGLHLQDTYAPQPATNIYQQNGSYSYDLHQSSSQQAIQQSPYIQPSVAVQETVQGSPEVGHRYETQSYNYLHEGPYSTPDAPTESQTSALGSYQPPGDRGSLPPPFAGNRVVDLTKSPLAYATDLETPAGNDALNGHRSPPKVLKDINRVNSPASDRSWARRSVDFGGSSSPAHERTNGVRSPWRSEIGDQSPHGSPTKGRAVSSPMRMTSPLADTRSVHSTSSLKRDSYHANTLSPKNSIDAGRSYTPELLATRPDTPPHSWQGTTPKIESGAQPDTNSGVNSTQYLHERSLSPEQGVSDVLSRNYGPYSSYNAPTSQSYQPPPRDRAMSSTSTFSVTSTSQSDPYAPRQPNQHTPPQTYGISAYAPSVTVPEPPPVTYEESMQEPVQYLGGPTHAAYAPSPTLLGSNDPLGRATSRAPIISFGFGGKFITCFHSSPSLSMGFDVALSGRRNTNVSMRILRKIISGPVVDGTSASFPGPLFGDPGSPAQSIVRAGGASSSAKAKKAKLLAYLSERIEESSQGLGYFGLGSAEHRRAEGKLTLLRLLRVLVEHDGQISGSPEIESAVRSALVPRLSVQAQDSMTAASTLMTTMATVPFGSPGSLAPGHAVDRKIAVYAVHASALDKLQEFLLKGEKRLAYHYALDERLWAHAMVISSSIDKDAFREVVNEFIKTELCTKEDNKVASTSSMTRQDVTRGATNGRECLRLAYSLYSGQTVAAVQQLVLPARHSATGLSVTLPVLQNQPTPVSPNFPNTVPAVPLPADALSNWQEYAATLYSGQMGADSSAALTALGDCLLHNDAVEAAHCCYLLSPLSSPMGGHVLPAARFNLLGLQAPQRIPTQAMLLDAIDLTEIAEYAFSLRPATKGQESFAGFPHLIVYRFIRACQLAEMGHISLARRYCEAITATIGTFRMSPYVTPILLEKFTELSKRLLGVPELDKASSWIRGNIAKPSLDSIGDWIGGRLTKFVAGETEASPLPNQEVSVVSNSNSYTGAFSHYSSISSTNTSTSPSPAPSIPNLATDVHQRRSGSAMAIRHSPPTQLPTDRASSAMDYRRPGDNNQHLHRIASASASVTRFAQTRSFSQVMESSDHVGNGRSVSEENDATSASANADSEGGGWWSAAYGDSNGATPTATTFKVDDAQAQETDSSTSGFISLMDTVTPQFSSSASSARVSPVKTSFADDVLEDDLGLGNSTKRHLKDEDKIEADKDNEEKKEPAKTPVEQGKPEIKASSSWLGRWWGRGSSNTPGPVKANLGEETTFYYDKELKRWVNKNASASAATPSPPPPPPARAQTASPMRSAAQNGDSKPGGNLTPPPPRPASAFETSGAGPPLKKTIPRVRSNLVPIEGDSAPSSPALTTSLSAPPPSTSRPASSASRRNVRNRYVDVFKEQNA